MTFEDLWDSVIVGVFEDYNDAVKAACEYSCQSIITLKEVSEFLGSGRFIRECKVE